MDIDLQKVADLKKGILPIYEPGLGELVETNLRSGRLQFTTELAEGLDGSSVVFIAVGTPQREDGPAPRAGTGLPVDVRGVTRRIRATRC
jgi:UDPglucose 6-dehydrogenase